MAVVNIVLTTSNRRIQQQTVSDDIILAQQDIVPSASSQVSTIVAGQVAGQDEFWEITTDTSNIRVLFSLGGVTAVTANTGREILANNTRWFRATPGYQPAIIISA